MASSSSRAVWEPAAWEEDAANASDDEHVPIDPKNIVGDEAADMLLDLLLAKMTAGKTFSAKSVCTICFWIKQMDGHLGKIGSHAHRPNNESTGHDQRKIDAASGVKMSDILKSHYRIDVPCCKKYDCGRSSHKLPVSVPYEALSSHVLQDPTTLVETRRRRDAEEWPRSYYEHLVVQAAPADATVVPYCIYVDGVPSTQRDRIIGLWIYDLVSMHGHLMVGFRKSEVCGCGCHGWCTYHVVFVFLGWAVQALAEGIHQRAKHDGKPWTTDDAKYFTNRGKSLLIRAACLLVKGDWMEWCSTFGFPTWSTNLHPCIFCKCLRLNMFLFVGFGSFQLPWDRKTVQNYIEACLKCELDRELTPEQHSKIVGCLEYDQRTDSRSGRGRCLNKDIEALNLKNGDRLEPSSTVMDVGEFERLKPAAGATLKCTFWRRANETATRHRNPFFDEA